MKFTFKEMPIFSRYEAIRVLKYSLPKLYIVLFTGNVQVISWLGLRCRQKTHKKSWLRHSALWQMTHRPFFDSLYLILELRGRKKSL